MNIPIFFVGLTLTTLGAFAADKPNVLILFSDDAGYADFGFQPNCTEEMRKLTPHIDTIARDGARFTNAYMSGCVCSPSRAGLNTGRYQGRFGFDNNLPPGFKGGVDLTETFGVNRLQEIGYSTGIIGKWHLGYPPQYHPNERGYGHFFGLLQGARNYFPMKDVSSHKVMQLNGTPTPEEGYVTDRIGNAACDFINGNKAEPFYLFVSFTAPHGPLQPKPGDVEKLKHIERKGRRDYAGLIVSLDDNIGRILACLKENGLDENTIVLFTNDNGGQTSTGAVNTPLKGRKGELSEGGVRVPWVMRWPGKIKPGSVINDPVVSLDILPTVVEAAGGKVDPAWKLDGTSLLGRITDDKATLPERPIFWRKGGSTGAIAMRRGKWKLHNLRAENSSPELYDLDSDIPEAKNLAKVNPQIVASMTAELEKWEAELKEPLWGTNSVKRNGREE